MTWLAEQAVLITAARIASRLRMDPVVVLRSTPDEWSMRLASAIVLDRDEQAAAKAAAAKSKSGG